jgi:hypothetical protein
MNNMELLLGLTYAFLRGLRILGMQLFFTIVVIGCLCGIGYTMYIHPIITITVAVIVFILLIGLNEE